MKAEITNEPRYSRVKITMKDVLGFLKSYEALALEAPAGKARTEKVSRIARLRRRLISISAIESGNFGPVA